MPVRAPTRLPRPQHFRIGEARRPCRQLAIVLGRSCALALAVLAAVAAVASTFSPTARAWLFPPDLGATATWVASSAFEDAAPSGQSTRGEGRYFMHTNLQDRPW